MCVCVCVCVCIHTYIQTRPLLASSDYTAGKTVLIQRAKSKSCLKKFFFFFNGQINKILLGHDYTFANVALS